MAELGFELLKWMFLSWMGHVAAVAGILALMLSRLR